MPAALEPEAVKPEAHAHGIQDTGTVTDGAHSKSDSVTELGVKEEQTSDATIAIQVKDESDNKSSLADSLFPETITAPSDKSPQHESPYSPPFSSPSLSHIKDQDSLSMERASSHASVASSSTGKKQKKAKEAAPVQLVEHLPRAENEALATFEEIQSNEYHDKKLGRAKGKFEVMVCECSYNPSFDDITMACSEESDCINRCTQVECLASDCRCGEHCQNQRFQKRQYAPVEVVQTEKKGFGLRAAADLSSEAFVYEYVGEVMNQPTFLQRMQQYREEGIRHFYFMMLQKDEYLDATKKGGKGRFINHSCNPNCFVAKWQVGRYMRMGIFTKRPIQKGEELTFNYNVDRYGNDPQTCYCGEPNCIGTLGGTTQTDISGMAELFIDALGITDQVEQSEARGTKKKKGMELDKDFVPILRPIQVEEVTKVMTAMRQAGPNRRVLQMLLQRIEMTEDIDVQKLLVKLHGFTLMAFLLDEWKDDNEIVMLTLSGLVRWPLIHKNKVVDLGIEEQVKNLRDAHVKINGAAAVENGPAAEQKKEEDTDTLPADETPNPASRSMPSDADISQRAEQLLDAWDKLDMGYRIARREANGLEGEQAVADTVYADYFDRRRLAELDNEPVTLDQAQAPNAVSEELGRALPERRPQAEAVVKQPRPPRRRPPPTSAGPGGWGGGGASHYSPARSGLANAQRSSGSPRTPAAGSQSQSIQEIIRQANKQEEQRRREQEEAVRAAREAEIAAATGGSPRKHARPSSAVYPAEKRHKADGIVSGSGSGTDNENRLRKMVGEIVVKQMSKHKDQLERETFKKYARELTNIIVGKEMKNPKHWPPPSGTLDEFSSEKRTKIKAFCQEYIAKLLARKGKPANSTSS